MTNEIPPSEKEPSLFLVGTGGEISALLQKTPLRVLHLIPSSHGGWEIGEEFLGENWKIKEENGNYYVSTYARAGGHPIGHFSKAFPIYKHPNYS